MRIDPVTFPDNPDPSLTLGASVALF